MHNDDNLDIPDFLRATPEKVAARWKGKRPRSINEMKLKIDTRQEPADVKAFRLEQEKKRKAKDKARFAVLRERAAEKKRQSLR